MGIRSFLTVVEGDSDHAVIPSAAPTDHAYRADVVEQGRIQIKDQTPIVCLHGGTHIDPSGRMLLSMQLVNAHRTKIHERLACDLRPMDYILRGLLYTSWAVRKGDFNDEDDVLPMPWDFDREQRFRCGSDFDPNADPADLAVGCVAIQRSELAYSFDCVGPAWDGSPGEYTYVGNRHPPAPAKKAKSRKSTSDREESINETYDYIHRTYSTHWRDDNNPLLKELIGKLICFDEEEVKRFDKDGDNELIKGVAILYAQEALREYQDNDADDKDDADDSDDSSDNSSTGGPGPAPRFRGKRALLRSTGGPGPSGARDNSMGGPGPAPRFRGKRAPPPSTGGMADQNEDGGAPQDDGIDGAEHIIPFPRHTEEKTKDKTNKFIEVYDEEVQSLMSDLQAHNTFALYEVYRRVAVFFVRVRLVLALFFIVAGGR